MESGIAKGTQPSQRPNWEADIRERLGAEVVNGVEKAFEVAIRAVKTREESLGLDGSRKLVMSKVQDGLTDALDGQKVTQERLTKVLGGVEDPEVREAIRAAGDFMIGLQKETSIRPGLGRQWINHTASEAVRQIEEQDLQAEAQGNN